MGLQRQVCLYSVFFRWTKALVVQAGKDPLGRPVFRLPAVVAYLFSLGRYLDHGIVTFPRGKELQALDRNAAAEISTLHHSGLLGFFKARNESPVGIVNHLDCLGARGCIVREDVTEPANFRAEGTFQRWLEVQGKIGLAGIDTRALTRRIRLSGAPNAVIAHDPAGRFDIDALKREAREWPGLVGMDLVPKVTSTLPADISV